MFLVNVDNMASSLTLLSILDANKLTGPIYVDWLRNLKRVLSSVKLSYFLDTPSLEPLGNDAIEEEKVTYKMWQNDSLTYKVNMELNQDLIL